MRVDELVAGVKADVAVLLYGDDMEILGQKGKEIERVLKGVPGAVDVKADYQANIPTLTIAAKPDQLARYGVECERTDGNGGFDRRSASWADLRGPGTISDAGAVARGITPGYLYVAACSGEAAGRTADPLG